VLADEGPEGVVDVTGPEPFSAADLAALFGELGGRPVEAVAVADEALVAGLVGDADENDHLRYGAELVATFGRSIREGWMASTDAVERLAGRPPRPLREVLEAALT
jgi:NAD(P)H dehydrogenase (quinone)